MDDEEKEEMVNATETQEIENGGGSGGSDENNAAGALLAGWTTKDRARSKEYLVNTTSTNAASKATPFEERVFMSVGETVGGILRYVLKRWHKAMKMRLNKHSLKPIKPDEQVTLIMEYLEMYRKEYELACGTMEEQTHPQSSPHPTVHIQSTGFAVKVFLGLIMADRLWAINQKRKALRETHGFLSVDLNTLTEDNKYCTICCDELGIANPEGDTEQPIRVVVCCHQVFGENCLKVWLKESWKTFDRDTCPNCRFKFPETFLEKLLGNDWKSKRDGRDEESDEERDDDEDADGGSHSDVDEEDESESADSSEDTATSSDETPVAEIQPPTPQTVEQFVNVVIVEGGLPFADALSAEVDTPMSNTQDDDDTLVHIVELAEEPIPLTRTVDVEVLPSIERGDDFMVEG